MKSDTLSLTPWLSTRSTNKRNHSPAVARAAAAILATGFLTACATTDTAGRSSRTTSKPNEENVLRPTNTPPPDFSGPPAYVPPKRSNPTPGIYR